MFNTTSDARGQRMSFERAIVGLNQAFSPGWVPGMPPVDKVANAVLSQSILRFEQPLVTTTNNYTFGVLNNQGGTNRITEVRLTPQDAFYISALRVSVSVSTPGASAAAMVLSTYPSPLIFTTSGSPAAMETLYNGYLSLVVNKDVVIPQFPLMLFRNVPQTQLTAATNSPEDQFDGGAFISIQPNPVLVGQKGSVLSITLPASIATVTPNSFLVVEAYGVLAQNVTVTS